MWVNLPARYKLVKPAYTGLQKEAIPVIPTDGDRVKIQVISGDWGATHGPILSLTDVQLAMLTCRPGGELTVEVPVEKNVFFYVVKGTLLVNGEPAESFRLLEFDNDGTDIQIKAVTEAVVLFGTATPYNEPVVSQGPFVMNTEDEIQEAYADFRAGKLGVWS